MEHQWIIDGLDKPGKSRSGLAKALGRSPSMVTALLDGRRQLKASEVAVIARYLDVAPPAGIASSVAVDATILPLDELKIIGEVAAGNWVDPTSYAFEPMSYPVPADPRFSASRQYLLRVKGTSINRRAQSGSLVRCLDVFGAPRQPQHNDWVVVERRKADGTVETTVKKLIVDRDGAHQLWPDSDDPAHQTPISIDFNDGDEVRVVAFVLDFINPATRL